MSKNKRPDIGTKMYFIHEHFYRYPGRAGPFKEYCVCEAVVTGFYTGGFTELLLDGRDPEGRRTPYYYRLDEIGESIFYTPREAALLAQAETEQWERHERTYGPLEAPEFPMRRPWKKYLEAEGEN